MKRATCIITLLSWTDCQYLPGDMGQLLNYHELSYCLEPNPETSNRDRFELKSHQSLRLKPSQVTFDGGKSNKNRPGEAQKGLRGHRKGSVAKPWITITMVYQVTSMAFFHSYPLVFSHSYGTSPFFMAISTYINYCHGQHFIHFP